MSLVRVPDWLYPNLEPPKRSDTERAEIRSKERLAAIGTHNDPRSLSEAYAKLHQEEMERLKSVESRLGGILRLASITASLLLGGMFALLKGGLGQSGSLVECSAAAALLYLNLQLACSTIAAVRGMGRATWEYPSIEDLIPPAEIGPIEFQRRVASHAYKRLLAAERNINDKVSQMAVAHAAIRNFATGSALFAVLGLAAVGFQQYGIKATKPIKANPEAPKLTMNSQASQSRPRPKEVREGTAPCVQPDKLGPRKSH